jgi:ankyrin repeat protein
VLVLIDFVSDPTIKNNKGQTPFTLACQFGLWDVIENLVQHGVDVNKPDESSPYLSYPLHHLVQSGRTRLEVEGMLAKSVELLLNKGANVNCRDKKGRTPLHICCEESVEVAAEPLLAQSGIEVNAQDEAGNTPLHYLMMDWYFLSLIDH